MEPEARFEVITTPTGVFVMHDRTTGEIMHPGVGPCLEAQLLYVEPSRLEARLREAGSDPLVLLDVGLGAGSNAAAALQLALGGRAGQRPLHVISFDVTVSALVLALQTEPAAFGLDGPLRQAARVLCEHGCYELERVRWSVCLGDLRVTLARLALASVDIVFWDPFSPRVSPALWSTSIFRLLRERCRGGATVHTYSAATATRSALLLSGFAVGKGPRAGVKQRSSTQAAMQVADLMVPLDQAWLRGLASNGSALPDDAPSDAQARIAALPQFTREPHELPRAGGRS